MRFLERQACYAEAANLVASGLNANRERGLHILRAANDIGRSSWFSFAIHGPEIEVFCFGTIEADEGFSELIAANPKSRFVIRFDCTGGNSKAAMKIGKQLRERGNSLGIVTGVCQSAANLILLGCQKRVARPNAQFLFHAARLSLFETSKGLRRWADWLDKDSEEMLQFISEQTRQPLETVQQWCSDDDLILNAEQAEKLGIIHNISPSISQEPQAPESSDIPADRVTDQWQLAYELTKAITSLTVSDKSDIRRALEFWLNESAEVSGSVVPDAGGSA